MLCGGAIHSHHHVLPRLLVARDVVFVNGHLHEPRIRPHMLRAVQAVLREVDAPDIGDLAVEGVGLDVRNVINRGDKVSAGVEGHVQVLVVFSNRLEQLLVRVVLVERQKLFRGRVVPTHDPNVHFAPHRLNDEVGQRDVWRPSTSRVEDLESGLDEVRHDHDLVLCHQELLVDVREEVHTAIHCGGIARHCLEASTSLRPRQQHQQGQQ
mmetsp:Transcript_17284/g.60389  ORF Transcript_17284/g.60389 Transcript_17284/m.60389 type:complete len:210 (-) Transcript_17284:155-784(-)